LKKPFGPGIFALLITAAAVTAVTAYILMPKGAALPRGAAAEITAIVRSGDIICRLGDRLWSQSFKKLSAFDRRFSHAGIARVEGGHVMVIHAEGDASGGRDFVREETLEDFLKVARSIGVYRLNDIDGAEAAHLALEYVGIPFDWQFDLNDGSKLYCTELVDIVLRRLSVTPHLETAFLKKAGKEIIPLESISRSALFTEVFYRAAQ
jgi:hypothetical protein